MLTIAFDPAFEVEGAITTAMLARSAYYMA
jgi:hypothetical protein